MSAILKFPPRCVIRLWTRSDIKGPTTADKTSRWWGVGRLRLRFLSSERSGAGQRGRYRLHPSLVLNFDCPNFRFSFLPSCVPPGVLTPRATISAGNRLARIPSRRGSTNKRNVSRLLRSVALSSHMDGPRATKRSRFNTPPPNPACVHSYVLLGTCSRTEVFCASCEVRTEFLHVM
jgi:hypothetical protein